MDVSTSITETPPVTTLATTGNTDGWKYRRRFMFAITAFDMIVTIIALIITPIESVAQIAIIMAFGSLTTIFGFYVAGAVWDDRSIRNTQLQSLAIVKSAAASASQEADKDKGKDGGP